MSGILQASCILSTVFVAMSTYSVSVTGLQLKGPLSYLRFAWVAPAAAKAAHTAEGNVYTSTSSAQMPNANGYMRLTQMTLTVWASRAATMKYVASKEHRAASTLWSEIASYGKLCHYESDSIPTWDEAKKMWLEHGKVYGRQAS